jgi:hypothetical protein
MVQRRHGPERGKQRPGLVVHQPGRAGRRQVVQTKRRPVSPMPAGLTSSARWGAGRVGWLGAAVSRPAGPALTGSIAGAVKYVDRDCRRFTGRSRVPRIKGRPDVFCRENARPPVPRPASHRCKRRAVKWLRRGSDNCGEGLFVSRSGDAMESDGRVGVYIQQAHEPRSDISE